MGFLVIDVWKLFAQTGNIETYLLLKEMEKERYSKNLSHKEDHSYEIETKM